MRKGKKCGDAENMSSSITKNVSVTFNSAFSTKTSATEEGDNTKMFWQ